MCAWELTDHVPIQSPGLWLTTSACGVPHLTPETLQMSNLLANFSGIHVTYEKQARSIDIYEAYQKGYVSYCGLDSLIPSLLTVKDPSMKSKSGFNTLKSIALWGENDQRVNVDREQYLKGVQALKPDAFLPLCDDDLDKDSSSKRVQKALKFTHESLEFVLDKRDDSGLKNKAIIGALEGGFSKEVRQKEAQLLASLPLDGYFLDGFHANGESSLDMNLEQVTDVITDSILPNIKKEKPRFFFGMLCPKAILELVQAGVDFFETSYVYHLTNKGFALSFPNRLKKEATEEAVNGSEDFKSDGLYLDLNDEIFKNDFKPILANCSCYTCRKHTRGYINHLLATKELLARVLLVIHNLHHYSTFFATIRECIDNDSLDQLKNAIS